MSSLSLATNRAAVAARAGSRDDAGVPFDPRLIREVALLALRLGVTAFGGPAVHIAMLHDEVVTRRRWMSEEEFLDFLGATNLIPGPNSTEMVMHAGKVRAGWAGFWIAGVLFILPAALIVLACAWAYVEYGKTPAVGWLLYGVKPVIIAVVLQALWGLMRTAVKTPFLGVIAVIALALYLVGVHELAILFGAGIIVLVSGMRTRGAYAVELQLFLIFLKIGSVLYGSGYVLLAFLRRDFVDRLGWITDAQLLDAVTVGQFTPGPLFTTATFIGYLVGGYPGAALATIGIFLPAFFFVAITTPFVARMRNSASLSRLLDGLNVASVAVMAGVTWQLARTAIIDVFSAVLAAFAALVLLRWKINSAWLVLAAALIALLMRLT
jgi:chromate transporter